MNPKIFAVLALALASTFATAQTPNAVAVNLTKASTNAVAAYNKGGVSGLISVVSDCWENDRTPPYCLYLDLSAKRVNDSKSASLRVPSHDYFSPNIIAGRLYEALSTAPLSDQEKHAYLLHVEAGVNQATDARLKR